jgi:cell division protein FtsN
MARDYKSYSNKKKKSAKKNHSLSILLGLGFVFIVAIAFVWFQQRQSTKKFMPTQAKKNVQKVEKSKPKHPKITFDFYNLLPKEKVALPPPSVTSTTTQKNSVIAKPKQYILQIASLRNYKDADGMRAKLLLKGFKTEVKKIAVNGSVWYRVQAGPYTTFNAASDAQNQLRKDNQDSLVKTITS